MVEGVVFLSFQLDGDQLSGVPSCLIVTIIKMEGVMGRLGGVVD